MQDYNIPMNQTVKTEYQEFFRKHQVEERFDFQRFANKLISRGFRYNIYLRKALQQKRNIVQEFDRCLSLMKNQKFMTNNAIYLIYFHGDQFYFQILRLFQSSMKAHTVNFYRCSITPKLVEWLNSSTSIKSFSFIQCHHEIDLLRSVQWLSKQKIQICSFTSERVTNAAVKILIKEFINLKVLQVRNCLITPDVFKVISKSKNAFDKIYIWSSYDFSNIMMKHLPNFIDPSQSKSVSMLLPFFSKQKESNNFPYMGYLAKLPHLELTRANFQLFLSQSRPPIVNQKQLRIIKFVSNNLLIYGRRNELGI